MKRNMLFVLAFFVSLFLSVPIHAAPIVVLDEDYDGLTPGDPLPGWVAMQPWNDPKLPWVQNTNFNSPPNGAAVRNDFDVAIVFDPIEGIVTLEVWMQCKLGSDTNCGIYFIPEGPLVHTGLVSKNETDQWFYGEGGIGVPFAPVSPTGHHIMIIYDTSTARYDLYFDGFLITSNSLWHGAAPGDRIIGVGTWSGRGGRGTTSYFDDLRVSYEPFSENVFLVIDEDSIDNGNPPNFFSDGDVNDDLADIGLRAQLAFFANNVGETIILHTGEVGDEGWFVLKTVLDSWNEAGPTDDGLCNFLNAGPGLGTEDANGDREALLDKIPDVTPLRATGLNQLEGKNVCAVVYDSDISINYDPLNGSLKGDNLGIVAFSVISVTALQGFSSSSLPQVEIEILDAEEVCDCDKLSLFQDAPEPISSSEPFDVVP